MARLEPSTFCILSCLSLLVPPAVPARADWSEGIDTGMLCVAGEPEAAKAIQLLKTKGVPAKRDEDNDSQCVGDETSAISFPEGLEKWAKDLLFSSGMTTAFGFGPYDENGYRATVSPTTLLSADPNPATLSAVRKDVECRIAARLKENFTLSKPTSCPTTGYKNGLCWDVTLTGHMSNSKVFTPSLINNRATANEWFKVESEIWMGVFPPNDEGDDQDKVNGDELKIRVLIASDKYAVGSPSKPPKDRSFKKMEVSDDEEFNGTYPSDILEKKLAETLLRTPMTCSSKSK